MRHTILRNFFEDPSDPGAGGAGAGTPEPTPPAGGEPPAGGDFAFSSLLTEEGSFKEGYTRELPEGLKEHWKTFDKYKSPTELMQGMANMASLVGQKQDGVQWPEKDADETTVAKFREQMGIPPEYKLDRPEELPEGLKEVWSEADDKTLQAFGAQAHAMHLRPEQVEGLKEWYINNMAEGATQTAQAAEQAEQAHLAEQLDKMKAIHGDKTGEVLKGTFDGAMSLLTNAEAMGGNVMTTDDAHELLTSSPGFKDAGVLQVMSAMMKGSSTAKFIEGGTSADSTQLDAIEGQLKDMLDPTTIIGKRLADHDPSAMKQFNDLNKKKHEVNQRNR